jgi:hypothetical protein
MVNLRSWAETNVVFVVCSHGFGLQIRRLDRKKNDVGGDQQSYFGPMLVMLTEGTATAQAHRLFAKEALP